jgi:hypothetical protein
MAVSMLPQIVAAMWKIRGCCRRLCQRMGNSSIPRTKVMRKSQNGGFPNVKD